MQVGSACPHACSPPRSPRPRALHFSQPCSGHRNASLLLSGQLSLLLWSGHCSLPLLGFVGHRSLLPSPSCSPASQALFSGRGAHGAQPQHLLKGTFGHLQLLFHFLPLLPLLQPSPTQGNFLSRDVQRPLFLVQPVLKYDNQLRKLGEQINSQGQSQPWSGCLSLRGVAA